MQAPSTLACGIRPGATTIGRMWQIETVPPKEWVTLAGFIHASNRHADGRVRCLHAEQGDGIESHAHELAALPADGACFVAARTHGELVGVAGGEIDLGQRRAWVRGPLTRDSRDDDQALRIALLDALRAALPQAQRFDAFPHVDEAPLRASLRAAGFEDRVQYHVLTLSAATPERHPWPDGVREPLADEASALAALHDGLFPATYLDGAGLLASRDATHRLFVVPGGAGTPAGYVYVQDQPLEDEGYVDFVGVAATQRGRGVGRALLAAAVHWAVVQCGRPRVSLTVRQGHAPALGLYEGAGFRAVSAGAQMVFERDSR